MAILSSMFGGTPTLPRSVNQVMPYGGTSRMGAAPTGMGGIGGIPGGAPMGMGIPGAGAGNPTGTGMSHMATPTGVFAANNEAMAMGLTPEQMAALPAPGSPAMMANRFNAKYNNPGAFNSTLQQGGIDPAGVNAGNFLQTYNQPYTNQSQANPWTRQHAPNPGMMAGIGQLFPNVGNMGVAGQDFKARQFMNYLRSGGNGLDYTQGIETGGRQLAGLRGGGSK